MSTMWGMYRDINKWNSNPITRQTYIDLLKNPNTPGQYPAINIFDHIANGLSTQDYMDILENFAKNKGDISSNYYGHRLLERAFKIDKGRTKDILKDIKSKAIAVHLLSLSDLSLEEETLGLRGAAKTKTIPNSIYINKYTPSIEALKNLPPVMRLDAVENLLTSHDSIRYNIFQNIPEDDFIALFFTTSLKYSERIENVVNKYKEIKYLGQKATLDIQANCPMCGQISITITSTQLRTKEGLYRTYLSSLGYNRCPVCGDTNCSPQYNTVKED